MSGSETSLFVLEIVVSVPKLDRYRGAVEIINSNLDNDPILTLKGVQMGEYFGASLCVIDLNNDGYNEKETCFEEVIHVFALDWMIY